MSRTDSKPLVRYLKEDQREALQELFVSHGWESLVTSIDYLVRLKGESVLTLKEDQRLLKAKAEYDGAKDLAYQIAHLKDLISKKA